ncbi:MAG: hypothetical protein JNK56_22025 [Myxococcales bacterium]|nr:hypothetical protein [Myxococcales bacterium]
MRPLDRELPWCAGRTVRELLAITGGLAIVAAELYRPGPVDPGNLAVYVLATLLLAVRWFAARAAAVGACIGAIVQQWPHLRGGEVTVETLALLPLAGVALLASRDLVDRFERAPSRLRWLANPWASFTAAETRTLRWSAYAAGALSGLLDHTLQLAHAAARHHPAVVPWWPRLAMVALVAALALLCLGRAVGLLLVWLTAVAVALALAPLAWRAEPLLHPPGPLPPIYQLAAPYLLPALLLALAAAALTTPAALRLLRRTLLRTTD